MNTLLRLRALAPALALALSTGSASAQVGARIEPLAADTLAALRPLAARGAAALVLDPDGGPRARITVAMPVRAPLATVRGVIIQAEAWPSFLPALGAVTTLSTHQRHAAHRMEIRAGIFDIRADTQLHEVSDRRVDFTIVSSDFGPAAARWDLIPDGPDQTFVVLTGWSDPSQGHWLLQRAAGSNPTATAGMNVAIDLVLALGVRRRAERLAGVNPSDRPAYALSDAGVPAPPERGPWDELSRRWYTLAFTLAPDGAVTGISTLARTGASAERVGARVAEVARWQEHLPSVRETRALDAGRVALTLRSPFDQGQGTVTARRLAPGVTEVEGDSGDLRGYRWRWDVDARGPDDTLVTLTGGVEPGLAALMPRTAASREPFLYAGLSGLRQLLWMRAMLAGLHAGE